MTNIRDTLAKYLVLDLTTFQIREEQKGPMEDPTVLKSDLCRTSELWLRRIEPGTFLMGSPKDELGRSRHEDQRQVTLTAPFYLGVFQVTEKQYKMVAGRKGLGSISEHFFGRAKPVNVDYFTIRGTEDWPKSDQVAPDSFLGLLRGRTGLDFDLPTEGMWEYACRAGTTTALNDGRDITHEEECPNLNRLAQNYFSTRCYRNKEGATPAPVGKHLPNAWGLFDMHGNIWEWCLDFYAEKLGTEPAVDPKGPKEGSYRVNRGGDFEDLAYMCRSANRNRSVSHWKQLYCTINVGFRLALTL
ncbi:formylglycine-generating enzyme family protein [bacterium]|nr:formylglycine-generating enzyme family protein [bacterium]